MKTTIDIISVLYKNIHRMAQKENATVKALVEEGLRHTLVEHERHVPFTLRKATFKDDGQPPELSDASWDRIWHAAYAGRGG